MKKVTKAAAPKAADPARVAYWNSWDSLVAEAERRISEDHAAKTLTRTKTFE